MSRTHSRRGAARGILWIAVAGVAAVIAILAVLPKPPEKTPEVPEKTVPVRVLVIAPRALPDTLVLPGQLAAYTDVSLAAEKPGLIVELKADLADAVTPGQVLLRLDDRSSAAALRRAEIEKRDADRELERWTGLQKSGAVSPSQFDAIRTRKEMADVALADAQTELSKCEVRSPVAGRVDDRHVELGEYVREGEQVFRVVDVERLKLLIDAAERDVRGVAPGMAIPFEADAIPGRAFTGLVAFVAEAADAATHTYRVEAAVPNGDRALRPGMIASASLLRGIREDAVVIPLAAVIPKNGEFVVFVVQDGRAARRVVRIDAFVGDEAVVGHGLRPGDAIVVEGHRSLSDGERVEIRS